MNNVNIINHMLGNMWTSGKSLVVAMAMWFSSHRLIKENINIDCLGEKSYLRLLEEQPYLVEIIALFKMLCVADH